MGKVNFSKYYAIDKIKKNSLYYERKMKNLELVNKEYNENEIILKSYPLRIIIETTEFCNLNCIMCQIHSIYNKKKKKLTQLDKETFELIADTIFPYLIEFHPTDIGEPLMSSWFSLLLNKVKKYDVLLDLTTNGTLLTERIIREMMPNLLDIKISFDALDKNKFEEIRRGADYDTILKNIDLLLFYRNNTENNATITLQMTLMTTNLDQLIPIINFAYEKKIDRVKAYHVFAYNDSTRNLSIFKNQYYIDKFEEIRQEAIKLANKLNLKLEISEGFDSKYELKNIKYEKCRLPWTEMFIYTNGDVYPCHSHNFNSFGNFKTDSFFDVRNSNLYKDIRENIILRKKNSICFNCGMNYQKLDEFKEVPFDIKNFLYSDNFNHTVNSIRWSSRSIQFNLKTTQDDKYKRN